MMMHSVLYTPEDLQLIGRTLHNSKLPARQSCSDLLSLSTSAYLFPRLTTKFGERAFSHADPSTWNTLPTHVHDAHNSDSFRKLSRRWPICLENLDVGEFDSCQGNVWDFTKSQGNVREKILSGKSGLKLFIVSCIFASIQVFSRIAHWASLCRRPQCWRAKGASATLKEKRRYLVGVCSVLSIKYMVLDHPVLHSYPHHWQ